MLWQRALLLREGKAEMPLKMVLEPRTEGGTFRLRRERP